MFSYSMIEWLFLFYFYCFFGWCFESTVVSISKRKLVNRGFLRGPFLPIYGSGAIMMLVVSSPFQDNLIMVYIAGCVGATALEYVTGAAMEGLFKMRYWDYSHKPFNYKGYVCLSSTLAWGGLTILMTEVVQRPVDGLLRAIPPMWLNNVTLVLTALLCMDFALSFKAALDLRDVLAGMDRAKKEMVHIQKRLDEMIANAGEDWANRREELTEEFAQRKEELTGGLASRRDELTESLGIKFEDLKSGIDGKLESVRELAQHMKGGYLDTIKEELLELKVKYMHSLESRDKQSRLKDFITRDIIRSNPSMSSAKFKEALEELQNRVKEIGRKDK